MQAGSTGTARYSIPYRQIYPQQQLQLISKDVTTTTVTNTLGTKHAMRCIDQVQWQAASWPKQCGDPLLCSAMLHCLSVCASAAAPCYNHATDMHTTQ
jgi:hypothetical protein